MPLTIDNIAKQFPFTPRSHIETNWPYILAALTRAQISSPEMICYALGTIKCEAEGFQPIAEGISKYNTVTDPFDKYISRGGNSNLSEAQLYRGAGYIQLSLKNNYVLYSKLLDAPELLTEGYKALLEPELSAAVFATYLFQNRKRILQFLADGNFHGARSVVNGPAALGYNKLEAVYQALIKLA